MCAEKGWNVLNVENRTPGGTCAQRGCDAKKPFVEAAAALDLLERLRGKGLVGSVKIDWSAIVRFKDSFSDKVPGKERRDLAEHHMELAEGEPRFIDPNTVQVNGSLHHARKLVIATGMVPRPLPVKGAELMTTSDELLDLRTLPKRLLFVGAGYISMEFAHVAARLGREIHIVQRSGRALRAFDNDLVQMLVEASRSLGIEFHFNSPLKEIERTCTGLRSVCGESGLVLDADLVVHGAGRVPSTMDLEADKGNIDLAENGGIAVNEFMQSSSNPDVYAAGDCAASPGSPLTPVANLEGKIVGRNLLEGNRFKPDYRGVASVVFTSPQLAMAGLTEEEAEERGVSVDVRFEDFTSHKAMRQLGVSTAAGKVLLEKRTGKVVGGHFLGPGAADMANCVAIAIRNKLTGKQLAETVYAYPTLTGLVGSLFKS
jgi:glutathione reductase (NADPH)